MRVKYNILTPWTETNVAGQNIKYIHALKNEQREASTTEWLQVIAVSYANRKGDVEEHTG